MMQSCDDQSEGTLGTLTLIQKVPQFTSAKYLLQEYLFPLVKPLPVSASRCASEPNF